MVVRGTDSEAGKAFKRPPPLARAQTWESSMCRVSSMTYESRVIHCTKVLVFHSKQPAACTGPNACPHFAGLRFTTTCPDQGTKSHPAASFRFVSEHVSCGNHATAIGASGIGYRPINSGSSLPRAQTIPRRWKLASGRLENRWAALSLDDFSELPGIDQRDSSTRRADGPRPLPLAGNPDGGLHCSPDHISKFLAGNTEFRHRSAALPNLVGKG
jgi:hypothetical protein